MAGQDDGKTNGDGGLSDNKVDPTDADADQNNDSTVTEGMYLLTEFYIYFYYLNY